MEFHALTGSAVRTRTDCAIVGVFERGDLSRAAKELDRRTKGLVARLLKRGDLTGKPGETLLLTDVEGLPCTRLLLVGCGPRGKFARKQYRKALAAALGVVTRSGATDAVSFLSQEHVLEVDPYYRGRLAAEVVGHALYRIPDLKSGAKPPAIRLKRFGIALGGQAERSNAQRGLRHGSGIFAGIRFARDLANLPANVCTPGHLAGAARGLARDFKTVRTRVLGEAEIRRLKMGAFLSVTAGTEEPAKLIVVEYSGSDRRRAPVVLVGKGITFDSGGISLKQPQGMDEMKFDMSGAATVLGTIRAAAELELPVNLISIVPACENMPGGRATRPGDIVRSMSGQTIEILNTDAEGRLILCDALTYSRRFDPDVVIDVATLTGACVVALGVHFSALMSNDESLAGALEAASIRADDRAWRMPLADEYAEQLKSNFADFANVGGREGGAVTAACFLAKFTEGLHWAHLDIAGTAYAGGSQKSSTGRPVPLLVDYLVHRS